MGFCLCCESTGVDGAGGISMTVTLGFGLGLGLGFSGSRKRNWRLLESNVLKTDMDLFFVWINDLYILVLRFINDFV